MSGRHRVATLPASALGDPEQVRRVDRFRVAHPDAMILTRYAAPRGYVDGEWYTRCSLRSLMDALEELRPAPGG